ncbi:MAG: hypothetical protein ACM3PP_11940 [Candidatus Saccharibacteria bacterium]
MNLPLYTAKLFSDRVGWHVYHLRGNRNQYLANGYYCVAERVKIVCIKIIGYSEAEKGTD